MKWFIAGICLNESKIEQQESQHVFNAIKSIEKKSQKTFLIKEQFAIGIAESSDNKPILLLDNDDLLIFGDIRIDNRGELLNILEIDNHDIDNEELVMFLYKHYGIDCFKKLVGEFSFVIWDKICRQAVAVRDQIGIKTLFWMKDNTSIWFASDIFLLENLFSLTKLNKSYFTEYYVFHGVGDTSLTPFSMVNRIPSASILNISSDREIIKNYWNVWDNTQLIQYKYQFEYEEHFRLLLGDAVNHRLQEANTIAMSGGLDSTSIYALAKQIETKNYTKKTVAICGIFPKYKESDESHYIDFVLNMYKDQAHYVLSDGYRIFQNFPEDSPWIFEPTVNSFTYMFTKSIIEKAKTVGATNLLSGYAGDHILSGSSSVIADLVKTFQLSTALKYCFEYAQKTRRSFSQVLWREGVAPNFKKNLNREVGLSINGINKNLPGTMTFNQKDFCRKLLGTKAHIFMDRTIAGEIGIDVHHPFLDRKLIEFMFRIPGTLRWNNGTTKFLLRHAMETLLPKEVLRRENKTTHHAIIYLGLKENWVHFFPEFSKSRVANLGLIQKEEWINMLKKCGQGYVARNDFWVLLAIESWLFRLEKKTLVNLF